MKDIRIFIASSIELLQERNELAFFVIAHEDEFARRGLRVRLAKWEYVDPMMTADRTEDRYLNEMYNCDAAFILFKNVAGRYTCEELEKALVKEQEGSARLKIHQVLFHVQCAPDSDAAKLKQTLPTGSYSIWSDMAELKKMFMSLVDRVAENPNLVDFPPDKTRTVSAFIAADEELAADRNAFADAILNLNDILVRRHVRIRLRFYEPSRHRDILELSEMALVLYHTTSNAFGIEQMQDAYARTMRDENPRRLYVFFRNEDESHLDKSFLEFRESFEKSLGHFFCRFENVDTLKLNFLLSLEDVLGSGFSMIKLEGKMIKADGVDVAEITKLPMVANNSGLNELLLRDELIGAKVKEQQEICESNPDNADEYDKLLALTIKKNDLEEEIKRELSLSFDLARRMAITSAREANETISKAKILLDNGNIKDALELLDGTSAKMDGVLGDISDIESILEQKLKTLEAWVDVELFRIDTVLVCTDESFAKRLLKAEKIFSAIIHKAAAALEKYRPKSLAKIYCRFSDIYLESCLDTSTPVELLTKALKIYRTLDVIDPDSCQREMARVYLDLANCEHSNNHVGAAQEAFLSAETAYKDMGDAFDLELCQCYMGLGLLYQNENKILEAQSALSEALRILRKQTKIDSGDLAVDALRGNILNGLGMVCLRQGHCDEAEHYFREVQKIGLNNNFHFVLNALAINATNNLASVYMLMGRYYDAEKQLAVALDASRCLAREHPLYFRLVATCLCNLGMCHCENNNLVEAEKELKEAYRICQQLKEKYPEACDPLLVESLSDLGVVYYRTKQYELSEREFSNALRIVRRLSDVNPQRYEESLAQCLNRISNLYVAQRKFELAERTYFNAIEIQNRLAQDNPDRYEPTVVTFLCNLATLYDRNGECALAEQKYSEAIDILHRLVDGNPARYNPDIAQCLIEVGNLYYAQGSYVLAEQKYSDALDIRRRILQEHRPKTRPEVSEDLLSIYNLVCDDDNVDQLLKEQGLVHVATDMVRGASLVDSNGYESEGFDDLELGCFDKLELDVATVLNKLGDVHQCMNRYAEAEKAFVEALEIRCRLAEANHARLYKDVADSHMRLARLYMEQGRVEDAEKKCAKALDIRRQIAKGQNNEPIAVVLNYLAHIHIQQGRNEDAERDYLDELAIYIQLNKVTPDKYQTNISSCLNNLGYTYYRLGRYADAEREYKKAIDILRNFGGNKEKLDIDDDVAHSLNALGLIHFRMRRYEEALKETSEGLQIFQRLNKKYPAKFNAEISMCSERLGNIHSALGDIYCKQNRTDEAEHEYEETLVIWRQLAKENPIKFETAIASVLEHLGNVHRVLGQVDKAEHESLEALGIRRRMANRNHDEFDSALAYSLYTIARLRYAQGRYDEAASGFDEELSVYRHLCARDSGKFESDMATCLVNLGTSHSQLGKFDEAEQEYLEAIDIYRNLAKKEPQKFDAAVTEAIVVLAKLHMKQGRFYEAEKEYLKALEDYRSIVENSSSVFPEKLVRTLKNIARLHIDMERLEDAEMNYIELMDLLLKYSKSELIILNPITAIFDGISDGNRDWYHDCAHSYMPLWTIQPQGKVGRYDPEIAKTLGELADLRVKMNRQDEAAQDLGDELQILRRLAELNPSVYTPRVASVLKDIADLDANSARPDYAEREYLEALEIFRQVSIDCVGKCDSEVAITLTKLALLHIDNSRLEEAEGEVAEVIQIRRQLVEKDPIRYTKALADTLIIMADLHIDQGRFENAEKEYGEAADMFKRLSDANPDEYASDFAWALNKLAILYAEQNRFEEATYEWDEIVRIRRKLAEKDPGTFEADLAYSLNSIANIHTDLGYQSEAEQEYVEALNIYRRLSAEKPEEFNLATAVLLDNLAQLHMDLNEHNKADVEQAEAFKIKADVHIKNSEFSEAEQKYNAALKICRRLARRDSGTYSGYLANTLVAMADLHYDMDQKEKALREYKSALEIRRQIADGMAEEFVIGIAQVLNDIARIYCEMNQYTKAESTYAEAAEMLKNCDKKYFDGIKPDLIIALYGLAEVHRHMNKTEDSEREMTAANEIFQEMSEKSLE